MTAQSEIEALERQIFELTGKLQVLQKTLLVMTLRIIRLLPWPVQHLFTTCSQGVINCS